LRASLSQRFGEERANRIAYTNRNMVIFPNFVINDIMAITLRTFEPVGPGQMRVNAWALAPKGEAAKSRQRRLFNYLEFLGPGGFGTPDDVEAMEMCQQGYHATDGGWNDISGGMLTGGFDGEITLRVFWSQWNRCMVGNAAA